MWRTIAWLAALAYPVLAIVWSVLCASQIDACKDRDKKEKVAETQRYLSAYLSSLPQKKGAQKPQAEAENTTHSDQCNGWCDLSAKTREDPVALFTLFLSMVVWLQLVWMARQERVLQDSAGAARLQAESIPLAERAYLFPISIQRSVDFPLEGSKPIGEAMFCISLKNVGRTPAVLQNFQVGSVVTGIRPPECTMQALPEHRGAILGANDPRTIFFKKEVKRQQSDDVWEGRQGFFVAIQMEYADMFGDIHEEGFCLQLEHKTGNFVLYPDDKLNYKRTRKAKP